MDRLILDVEDEKTQNQGLTGLVVGSILILFACSSVRHILFKSNAYDLGIFDQAVYLISQGEIPISSFMGYHILGDHAAGIWYPLALLYKIYPTVYWLFAVQAIALGLAAVPIRYLALQAGLLPSQTKVVVISYLLYPQVFNANLYDFHPEVIAVPGLLMAVFAARTKKPGWYALSIVVILACKAVLSLTVAAMGFWLLVFEKRRWYGFFTILGGLLWFAIASKLIIPFFSGKEAAALSRYSYLGNSVFDIVKNIFFKPELFFGKVFSAINLEYLILLFIPIVWGISRKFITPLIAAIPCIALNLLSDSPAQKNLVNQYSIPVVPFLILVVIGSFAANKPWLRSHKAIIIWSLIGFLALGKYTYFGEQYLKTLDTWHSTRQAIALVQTPGSVLTTATISTHLTHRKLIRFTDATNPPNLTDFEYVLLNIRHPGWLSNKEFAESLLKQLQNLPEFNLQYQENQVYLFQKII
jgi:uncharacterized membrane protein